MKKRKYSKHIGLFGVTVLLGGVFASSAPVALAKTSGASSEQTAEKSLKLEDYLKEQKLKQEQEDQKAFDAAVDDQEKAKGITEQEEDDPLVHIIVQLEDAPAIEEVDNAISTTSDQKKLVKEKENTIDDQQSVKNKVEKLTDTKADRSFGVLINGFSIDCRKSDVEKIKKISGVKDVTASRVFTPQDDSANVIGQATKVWEDYEMKGEGEVIAIIDSGIDYNHKDLKLSDATTPALEQKEVESNIENLGHGKYYTEKVPYGYNYADHNDNIIDPGVTEMHGMHVAGITAANGDTENGGVKGVAPEAQLLAMRVFSNNPDLPNSAFDDIMINAIEDSVTLGADVFNMSIGGDNGYLDNNDPIQIAVNKAAQAGVLPAISAGNAAVSALQNNQGNPIKELNVTDTSMVGNPGTTEDAICVASSENSKVRTNVLNIKGITFDGDKVYNGGAQTTMKFGLDYSAFNQVHEIADCGYGKKADVQNTDVKGKIALIQRGSGDGSTVSFAEKVRNADAAGAVGVIIYNNQDAEMSAMDTKNEKLGCIGISQKNGEILKQNLADQKTFELSITEATSDNPNLNRMSTFSSWGPTSDLEFKPEITAPGSFIYSLADDDQYQSMNGTSMASPFIAGAATLLNESVKKSGLGLSGIELSHFEKNILMNTANPIIDIDHTNEIISPRRQGAGEVQISDAISGKVTATDPKTEKACLTLKEVGKTTSFSVELKNYGTEDSTYHFNDFGGVYHETADANSEIYDTKIQGATLTADKQEVTVPAGSTATVNFTMALPDSFEKNSFAEGFIGFDGEDGTQVVIPYLGFYGNYDSLPIIANLYSSPDFNAPVNAGYLYASGTHGTEILGLEGGTESINKDMVAISPNDDNHRDNAIPNLFFLRNYYSATYEVVDAKDNVLRTLAKNSLGLKNTASSGSWTYHNSTDAKWDGTVYDTKTGDSKKVEDGQYWIKASFVSRKDGTPQTTYMPVKVDTKAPEIKSLAYDENADCLQVEVAEKNSGIDESISTLSINGKKMDFSLKYVSEGKYKIQGIGQYLEQGKNKIELALEDNAMNAVSKELMVDASSAKGVILYNLKDKDNINLSSGYYDKENKTFTVKGSYDPAKPLFANGEKVTLDKDGLFETAVAIDDTAKEILFSSDKEMTQKVRTYSITVDVTAPTLDYPGMNDTVKVDSDSYAVKGTTDAVKLLISNPSTGESIEAAIANGAFDETVSLGSTTGTDTITVVAYDENGNHTDSKIDVKGISGYGAIRDYIDFENVPTADGSKILNSGLSDYDEKTGEYTIKGKLKQKASNFKLNGETVKVDPNDLSFEYKWKIPSDGEYSLSIYLQDDSLNGGAPLVDSGVFFFFDRTFPAMEFPNIQSDKDGKMNVYTNQTPYIIKANVTDNFSGYSLTINNDEVYQDPAYYVYNNEFFKDRKAVEVTYPVALQEGENTLTLRVTDNVGNYHQSIVKAYYHKADLKAPVIKADTTELTNKPVKLTAEDQPDDMILNCSLDGGKTWQEVKDAVAVTENSTVQFKYSDKYGNESPVTVYEVKNIQAEVAAGPVIDLTKQNADSGPVTVTLNYDKTVSDETAKTLHLRYSYDGGKTWKEYTKPFTVDKTSVITAQSYDDYGNASDTVKSTVAVEQKTPVKPDRGGETPDQPVKGDTTKESEDKTKKPDKTSDSKTGDQEKTPAKSAVMYRAYNPNSGGHLFTLDKKEWEGLIKLGWSAEGKAWTTPEEGTPVYRLYNPNSGEHFYTLSKKEYDLLGKAGWSQEDIGFYSDKDKGQKIYRLYNPNDHQAGSHHYTTSAEERDKLVKAGWSDEGIAFYGLAESK